MGGWQLLAPARLRRRRRGAPPGTGQRLRQRHCPVPAAGAVMWLAALLIAVLLGYCCVRLWLPSEGGRSPWTRALHASLGIGLGIGITSCLYFLLLVAGAA